MEETPKSAKKICIVTCNRSDWSKLQPVAANLAAKEKRGEAVKLDIVALGSHMLQELGGTLSCVKEEFPDAYEAHTLVAGDSTHSMTDSVGFGIIKLTSILSAIQPDVVVVHGDRFDAFCAAVTSNMLNIVLAHIEGGELSGTVDGTIRHAITKLAHLHFACTDEAARRIRGMGENPTCVFVTGCPSYDNLFALPPTSWVDEKMDEFFTDITFEIKPQNFIIAVMHSVTNDLQESTAVYECMLMSLFEMRQPTVLFYPNIDPGNKTMIQILHIYQKKDPMWHNWLRLVTHVPPGRFTALMMHAAAMVGNSSAGIRETCVFGTPTLNMGSRQDGRRTPANVTTLKVPTAEAVLEWFKLELGNRYAPSKMYGYPDSSHRIADILAGADVSGGQLKQFWEPQYSMLPPPSVAGVLETKKKEVSQESKCLKILGLITARGGSKGIPRKNIIDLNGKPLIQYTVDAALQARGLDKVVISTDSEEIAAVAKNCGCEVPFLRPEELARDDSPHLECVVHALDALRDDHGYEPDCVLLLQPTSPFRTSQDIDKAIDIMEKSSCDLVVSVCEESANLSKKYYCSKDGDLTPYAEITTGVKYIRRQELAKTYGENGAIYLQRATSLRSPPLNTPNAGSLRSDSIKGYIMPEQRSLDIDTPFDLHMARLLMATPFKNASTSSSEEEE